MIKSIRWWLFLGPHKRTPSTKHNLRKKKAGAAHEGAIKCYPLLSYFPHYFKTFGRVSAKRFSYCASTGKLQAKILGCPSQLRPSKSHISVYVCAPIITVKGLFRKARMPYFAKIPIILTRSQLLHCQPIVATADGVPTCKWDYQPKDPKVFTLTHILLQPWTFWMLWVRWMPNQKRAPKMLPFEPAQFAVL